MNSSLAKAALPYAEALFDSSQSMQLVDETSKDLSLILQNLNQSAHLKSFLDNPLLQAELKRNVLSRLFEGQVRIHVLNFLRILVDRRRISLLSSVIELYTDLVNKSQLILLAEVSTVVALTDQQKQDMEDKIMQLTGSKEIQLIEQVDPELIGGFIVKIGSKVIDMSIYGQLIHMSSYLSGNRL